jgi:hypothetical protein
VRLFDRFLSRAEPPPPWAAFMSAADFARFVEVVEAECAGAGRSCRVDRAAGIAYVDYGLGEEPSACGLQNVAQLCGRNLAKQWPEIVKDHFTRLSQIVSEAEKLETLGDEFEEIRPLLKVRLYPPDYPVDKCVYERPAEDLVACLVFDLPESVVAVAPEVAAKWPVPREELFRIGMANVRGEEGIQRQEHDVGDGCRIHSLTGDSFFVASQALIIEDFLPNPIPEMGALIAIPHRHMVIFHPILDATCVTALNRMLPMAKGIFDEGPGSVSPSVYWWREAAWWHDGQFTRFPVTYSGRKMNVEIPPEFAAKVLDRLA